MEPLSKSRERRANAGNRMGALLDKEEDDFYKSTYGGFFEVCWCCQICFQSSSSV